MTTEKKTAWKCKNCLHETNISKTPDTIKNGESYITHRKIPPILNNKKSPIPTTSGLNSQDSPTCDSFILSNDETLYETSIDRLSESADYTSVDILYDIEDYKEQIENLKSNLISTQNELENTIVENNDLRRQIYKMSKEIEFLKSVSSSRKFYRIRKYKQAEKKQRVLPRQQQRIPLNNRS